METITFTWEDGTTSYESFKDNSEFYTYMKQMANDGYYPVTMTTDGTDLIGDGWDNNEGKRIEIETPDW
jgi:hypothetical protein